MSRKRNAVMSPATMDDSSNDSFCGFGSDEESSEPVAKRFMNVSNNGRCSVISQYTEMDEKILRKPTRRPDPKVNNRNALMARENRRRHKEHLEKLEKANAFLSKENEMLKNKLKARDKLVASLRYEYKYLKSVIANKTQIVDILNSIKHSNTPMTSSLVNFQTKPVVREGSPSESSVSTDTAISSGSRSPTLTESSDYEMDANALATDSWASDPIFTDIPNPSPAEIDQLLDLNNLEPQNKINVEHSYSESIEDPGICVHISNQKVSIEFCASCHRSATNEWTEENEVV